MQLLDFSYVDCVGCILILHTSSAACVIFQFLPNLVAYQETTNDFLLFLQRKYCALAVVSCELHWFLYLLWDLHATCNNILALYCEIKSTFTLRPTRFSMSAPNILRLTPSWFERKLKLDYFSYCLCSLKNKLRFFHQVPSSQAFQLGHFKFGYDISTKLQHVEV